MKRSDRERLQVALTEAIERTIQNDEAEYHLPWLGDEVATIMAAAAMAVLDGIADAQLYLRENEMLKDD